MEIVQKLRLYKAKMVNSVTGTSRVHFYESLRGALEYAKVWQGVPGVCVYVKTVEAVYIDE